MSAETTGEEAQSNAQTHVEITGNSPTESEPEHTSTIRRKTAKARRSGAKTKHSVVTAGFDVPIGDSGQFFHSAWRFGE